MTLCTIITISHHSQTWCEFYALPAVAADVVSVDASGCDGSDEANNTDTWHHIEFDLAVAIL